MTFRIKDWYRLQRRNATIVCDVCDSSNAISQYWPFYKSLKFGAKNEYAIESDEK
jgi:hypothetical protein